MFKRSLHRLLHCLQVPIRENAVFFLFMLMLGEECIVFEPWNSLRHLSLFELVLELYVFCLLLTLLPLRLRRAVRLVSAIVAYAVSLLDCTLYVCTGAPLTSPMLRAILATTGGEASEALHAYLSPMMLFSPVGLILLLAMAHVGFCLYGKWQRIMLPYIDKVLQWILPVMLPLGLCLSLTNERYLFHRLVLAQSDTQLPQSLMDANIRTGYYLPVYRLWISLIEIGRDGRAVRTLPHTAAQATVDSCTFTSPHIVFILGESYNRHHASLYGYPLPTTPITQRLKEEGELYLFTDMVTPWNFTTEAIEQLLSTACIGDSLRWFQAPLITTLMRSAGYHVQFLSNQYVLHPRKNLHSLIDAQLLANEELSRMQFSLRNAEIHPYDEALLQDYDSLHGFQTDHNFIIFHLHGQHVEFADRIPPSRRHFRPSNYHRPDLNARQLQILSDYDNAMRYGDSVVSQILSRFQNEEAIVLFLSDHGERAFDGSPHYGRSNGFEPSDIRQQYEIPFWIWVSPSYAARHAALCHSIGHATTLPYSSDRLPHLIMHLAGLHTPAYQPSADPLHPNYDARRPRMLRGRLDYDHWQREQHSHGLAH